jgi:hypothetical protein
MDKSSFKSKRKEWLRRYIPAEILGTATALTAALITFNATHSYAAAALAGWVFEGLGFFGYFITIELLFTHEQYAQQPPLKRLLLAVTRASTNLLIEFLPAELIDNFLIRPFAMYIVPQHIHPYPVGFLVAKFSADIIFYAFAIVGYEARKKWFKD